MIAVLSHLLQKHVRQEHAIQRILLFHVGNFPATAGPLRHISDRDSRRTQ